MVGLASVLAYLYPAANPPLDYSVVSAPDGEHIGRWNVALLGAQPNESSLATTQASQAYIDFTSASAVAARIVAAARVNAIADYANGPDGLKVVIRALALVILDEINILRSAASLAPRSASQIKTAITAKINAGTADSQ